MTSTTTLYLIRHAATEANERRPYILQGCNLNPPLSAQGRLQAASVARFLADRPITTIYCSPLVRALETAQTIAGPHGLQPHSVEDLRECNVGRWEGKDWDTIAREFPDAHAAFNANPADTPYFGGESYRNVLDRILPAIERLCGQHGGEEIAIVGHNVVNRVYLASLLNVDLKRAKHICQSNGGVNVIRLQDGKTELRTLNSDFHLPAA